MLLCSYCIRPAALLKLGDAGYPYSRDYGPTWVCVPCRAWVGCHPGTEKPLGRVADAALRLAKMAAHQAFDRLWRKKMAREGISKSKARRAGYAWLSEQLGIPFEQTHIGYFDVAQCERVVDICTNPTTRSTTMPKQPLPTPAAFCDKPYVHIPLTPVVSNQVAAICAEEGARDFSEESARNLRDIRPAALLALGLLWMTERQSDKVHRAYTTLRDALGGKEALREGIQAAMDAGHEADHPQGADWWAGKREGNAGVAVTPKKQEGGV